MPDQTLVLEWETVNSTVHPEQVQRQKEIAQAAETRKDQWLYDLGFKQFTLDFSVSLDYFLRFSRCFVRHKNRGQTTFLSIF